jgi:anaerobic ribonucleoside-triphosphate reductase activating protein
MNNPKPKEWLANELNRGYVADYKPFNFVDGEGVRNSLYVSGCLFACEGCFNKVAQNFSYGTPYTDELEERILSDLRQPYVQGLTLLGGEPFLATNLLIPLVKRIRAEFGQTKDIWCWTGYTWEELLLESDDKLELLEMVNILVDGRFDLSKKDLSLRFRGSSNQRIIDVHKSVRLEKLTLWEEAN